MRKTKCGYGLKNGTAYGRKHGGRGRNITNNCCHPSKNKTRR